PGGPGGRRDPHRARGPAAAEDRPHEALGPDAAERDPRLPGGQRDALVAPLQAERALGVAGGEPGERFSALNRGRWVAVASLLAAAALGLYGGVFETRRVVLETIALPGEGP